MQEQLESRNTELDTLDSSETKERATNGRFAPGNSGGAGIQIYIRSNGRDE